MLEPYRVQMAIWRMRIALLDKHGYKQTHLEYVIT